MSARASHIPPVLLAVLLIHLPAAAGGETIYLEADFDDKPLDLPIGTGGAAVGEPVDVAPYVIATVRATPLATPSLEIQDNDTYYAGSARFELLDSIEISTGIVNLSFTLWFHDVGPSHAVNVNVREQGSSAQDFTNLDFREGTITVEDASNPPMTIGGYEPGRPIAMAVVHDLDAGTYDIWIDGALAVDDAAHGITGRGIGALLFGCAHDADLEGRFNVDDIRVSDSVPSPVAPAAWGAVKALFR